MRRSGGCEPADADASVPGTGARLIMRHQPGDIPEPDLATARRHIELLTGSPDTAMHWRLIHDRDRGADAIKLYGLIADLWPDIVAHQGRGYGVFLVVNEGGQTRAEITRVRSAFADGDDMALPESWHVPPAFLVVRDRTHWHAYWPAYDLPLTEFTSLQKRLAAHYGSDRAVCDLPRVMRLAGSLHQKRAPVLVTLDDRTGGAEYWEYCRSAQEIGAGLPVLEARKDYKSAACEGDKLTPQEIEGRLYSLDPSMPRDQWIIVAGALHATPCTDPEFDKRTLFTEWSSGGDNFDGAEDCEKTYDTMPPKEGGVKAGTFMRMTNEAGYAGANRSSNGGNPAARFAGVAGANVARVQSVAEWATLDDSILLEGRRAAPALPPAIFGSAWPELVTLAADKGAPVDYVALGWLVVSASLIGSKRRVVPYAGSTWEEPSILWLGLVGDPSHNKSPSLDPFQNILRRLEDERTDEHLNALSSWRAECERAKIEKAAWQESVKAAAKDGVATPPLPDSAEEPDEPRRRRYYVQDATPESMGAVLLGNPQGSLMIRDELAGWLESFDRYNPGGRTYWLEAYGGRPYTIDRKGSPEPLQIPYNGVNVIGGIQPGKLAECLLHATDDGMAARLLFTWPTRPPWSRPNSMADLSRFDAALRRLDSLDWTVLASGRREPRRLFLDPAAADAFDRCQQFYRDQEAEAGGLLKSFIGKLSGLTLRLALASEFAEWAYSGGPEPRLISTPTLEAVANFVTQYVLPMAALVYGDAALPPAERNAATLAKHIKKLRLRSINTRELQRVDRLPGLRTADDIRPAVEALVEGGWLKPDPHRKGGTVGRASRDYLVNPATWCD